MSPLNFVMTMIVMMIVMMARVIGDTKHGGGLALSVSWWRLVRAASLSPDAALL